MPDTDASVQTTVADRFTPDAVADSTSPDDTFVVPPSADTTSTAIDTGDVIGFDIIEANLGGDPITLALADESGLRSRGLMGVTGLGALDGMLFSWGGETVSSRFTMRNTLIPLRIVFFDAGGTFVSQEDMVPCDVEDCPTYGAAGPYAYAIEFPAGTEVSPDDRLEFDLPG